MEPDDEHGNGNETSFWTELDSLLAQDCSSHSEIDDSLRSYLSLISHSQGNIVLTKFELRRCAYKLVTSPLFSHNADYIRRQFVYSLLQEDDTGTLLGTSSFLLADARTTERTFEILNEAGAFTRLVDLIGNPKDNNEDDEVLNRMLMELLYEMARIQKISLEDLEYVHDDFVCCLFDRIEQVSLDVSDPYHYPVIRVLLVLNEQFMVAAHHPLSSKSTVPLTNKVVKVLSVHGRKYKTFGENIILLLNREDETSLQLLTLKILYLLFTTPSTYEYFYTNDLRVLVDILIRNLLDLPEEAAALRHTYLRVLYPLLQHTQLQHPPHYKQAEIRKLLTILGGGRILEEREDGTTLRSWSYFEEIDDTTKRLVQRCQAVAWLIDDQPGTETPERTHSPAQDDAISEPTSPASPSKPHPPAVPAPRKLTKRTAGKASSVSATRFLTPQLEGARQSSWSVIEMAAQKEKPGVITPSRNPSLKHTLCSDLIQKKEKPPLPQARRSALTRTRIDQATRETPISHDQHDQSLTKESPQPPKAEDRQEPENRQPPQHPKVHQPANNHVSAQPNKKPPPAPRARRWGRGKRVKEDDQLGKFDATLPSVSAATNAKATEAVSTLPDSFEHRPSSDSSEQVKQVEQIEQGQKQALDGIAYTLNKTRLEGAQQTHPLSDLPITYDNGTKLHTIVERPAVVVHQVIPLEEHALSSNPTSPQPLDSQPSAEPKRSPFLSEAEVGHPNDGGEG